MATKRQRCFVIMPISKTNENHTEEYWTKHFNLFVKPLIESSGPITAERSSPLRGDILRQIITDLLRVSIVVADLTDANANVYWELGVRQSFKHGTITIAEKGTPLPFDLGGKGTLFYYPDDHIKMQEFRDKFKEAIQDCLDNPHIPDSHVLETIGGRGTLYQVITQDESLRKLDAVLSEIMDNQDALEDIIASCKKNTELRKQNRAVSYPTIILRCSAVEALVINRYVDATKEFYYLAENYMSQVYSFNTRLTDWPSRPSTIEPWLIKGEAEFVSIQKDLMKQVKKLHKSLESI